MEDLQLEDFTQEELEAFMVSEEYQQLDELSKATLGRYVEKSATRFGSVMHKIGADRKIPEKATTDAMVNRKKGITGAVKRLTKESVDLVQAIKAGSAIKIESAFDQIVAEKVASAIDQRRQEIAHSMFD